MNIEFDIHKIPTPYYIVEERLIEKNCKILKSIIDRTSCRILLAQKAFSMYYFYPLIGQFLNGTTASGLYEAKLGKEEMGKETHIFSPAYKEEEFDEISNICDHIIFNSFSQAEKFKEIALAKGKECGIRINPEFSTQDHAIYDPCSYGSRFGVTKAQFREDMLDGISGLHFHTLCEQDLEPLQQTLQVVEEKFGSSLKKMKWVNFGGGHHITREGYDVEGLVHTIQKFQDKYDVTVYLEPGEAVALNSGYLVSTVMDLLENGFPIAILDTSAACHMPDVLEMPYRPHIIGSGMPKEKKITYRLGGPTCLAGDIIGDYSFDEPLHIGDKLIFCDMAHYSMVKNNTFNGMALPSIAAADKNNQVKLVKKFGYEDFKCRV